MVLKPERLVVYRLSINCVAWVFERCEKLNGVHRHAHGPVKWGRNQLKKGFEKHF